MGVIEVVDITAQLVAVLNVREVALAIAVALQTLIAVNSVFENIPDKRKE